MRNPFLLLCSLFLLVCVSACHRPYALVQRTPAPRFTSPPTLPTADSAVVVHTKKESAGTSLIIGSETKPEETEPIALAAVSAGVVEPRAQSVTRRVRRIESLLHESAKTIREQPRPRPRSRGQLRLGNRIRQSLGLPLREELNWWQRIDWKLKASVFVIGVAILFAILNLGQLALLFGLIGAVLLVLGLKRSFKRRRPWL